MKITFQQLWYVTHVCPEPVTTQDAAIAWREHLSSLTNGMHEADAQDREDAETSHWEATLQALKETTEDKPNPPETARCVRRVMGETGANLRTALKALRANHWNVETAISVVKRLGDA